MVRVFILLLVAMPAFAQSALTNNQLSAIRKIIQAAMAKDQAPGSSFAIGLNGRVVWAEGFGLADVENRVPAKRETAYRTASIGKPMTATAAMKLCCEGAAALGSRKAMFPDYRNGLDQIIEAWGT